MEAIIINYRRGRRTQKPNQMIIMVEGQTKEDSLKLLGKEVTYVCEGKSNKVIKGKVSSLHGNKGALRVIFERGMPGQSVGMKVKVN